LVISVKKVLLITDGKVGHEAVSYGLIEGIERHFDTEVTVLPAKMRLRFMKSLFPLILNHVDSSFWKKIWGRIFYSEINFDSTASYHLVISTGGMTAYYNVMLATLFGIPNIYLSSLRRISHEHFSYVVSIVPLTVPNAINVELAPAQYQVSTKACENFLEKNEIETSELWGVLIGGSTEEYPWNATDIEQALSAIADLARKNGVQLLVSTSRRSGEEVESVLDGMRNSAPESFAHVVCYGRKPEKVATLIMALSKKLFITEDSGSMITEGILSKTPLFSIKRAGLNLQGRYADTVRRNVERGYIKSIHFDGIDEASISETSFKPLASNSSEKIVEILKPILDRDL